MPDCNFRAFGQYGERFAGRCLPTLLLAIALMAFHPGAALAADTLRVAVNSERPGYMSLMMKLAKDFNTRAGTGEAEARNLIALVPVESDSAALTAMQAGRVELALASTSALVAGKLELADYQVRPLAKEVLTISTRRISLIQNPKQLYGLNVEIAGDRIDEIVGYLNAALKDYGITFEGDNFASAPEGPENDPYLRLCRSEYDVRVDMVIHPYPPFAGTLPCELRMMNLPLLKDQDGLAVRAKPTIIHAGTYNWLRYDFASLGAPVVLIGKKSVLQEAEVYADWADYVDTSALANVGVLSKEEAEAWSAAAAEPQ